ncbi:hypothetical protein PMI38_04846 [Pseudomonas sp. GM84]|uniref:hypothetical protein n=1 Tax=Pseudomonas sp. GM84 TaxID=1144340 RepID=UPI00026FD06E|nr:hypothetical protein [Pseudomonas sp. GM84]EJN33291.1 hypothetical protein PMI38_04846 [Pseudomonas sp. GM84]
MPTENRSSTIEQHDHIEGIIDMVGVPEGYMLVERSIWTEKQVDAATACITRLKGVPTMTDRALAMAAIDAAQCTAPDIALSDLLPAPQPHPEPMAWMVGTAFWWTKEEAERDAAETGLPIVGLGPMTDPGEVERLRSIERSYGLREALLEQVKGERDRMIARTMELSGQLADQDALLHKLKETLQREYWDEYAGLDETRELIDVALSASAEPSAPDKQGSSLGAVRAPEIQDLLDRAATAIGQYGDSLLGRGQREDSVDLLDLEREVRDLEQEFKGAFALPSR